MLLIESNFYAGCRLMIANKEESVDIRESKLNTS